MIPTLNGRGRGYNFWEALKTREQLINTYTTTGHKTMKLELMTGHLTWWTMGTQTDPVILRESLAEIDLDKYEPNERTWLMSLKSALSDMFQGQYMIRPLDKREVNGYSVVEECKDDVQNDYTTHATARVDDSGGVTVNNFGSFSINLQKLQELTDWYRKTIPGDSVSKILVSILKDELKGISIRDGGCLYFLPEESYDKWVDVCHAVKNAAVGGCVNKTTTHTMERTVGIEL